MVAIADPEHPVLAFDPKPTLVELVPVLVSQHSDEDSVAKRRVVGRPVDVECRGVLARSPVLEDVVPPSVGGRLGGHVIRHDVEHMAESVGPQRGEEHVVAGLSAELLADAVVVDRVVAVHAPRRSLKDRRRVEVGHAQVDQVRADGGCVGERESGVELKPIGRQRCAHCRPSGARPRSGAFGTQVIWVVYPVVR